MQRRRLCRVRAEPAIANVPQERGPLLEIVPPTSTPLNVVPHSPVVSPSRTVREPLLSAFFALHKVSHALRAIKIRHWHVRFLSETNIRKKADGKKQRGARLEGLPCGEPIARPPWCFRPPPVGRPGRSHRPQGCGLGRICGGSSFVFSSFLSDWFAPI